MSSTFDPKTATLDEHEAQLRAHQTALDRTERALADARRAYQQAMTGPNHDIAELRERREAEAGPRLRAAELETTRIAGAIGETAHAIGLIVVNAPLQLSPSERLEADAVRGFAKDAAESLPLDALVAAVRAAVLANDRPLMYAFASYSAPRLKSPPVEIGSGRTDPESGTRADLRLLVSTIRETLQHPGFAPIREEASAVQIRAGGIRRDAERNARAERAAQTPYPWRKPDDVSW